MDRPRVNQILEDMLRACALNYGSSWDDNLPYAEFSYNNNYQASLKMALFEALYGRRCRAPLMWDEVGDRQLFGPDLIKESEEKRRYFTKSEIEHVFACPLCEELNGLELRENLPRDL